MKAMPVEEAKPRTTFCIRAKKHLKGERLFYKRFAFFRIKAHRNKNNTHTFVYAAKGCAMGRKVEALRRRCHKSFAVNNALQIIRYISYRRRTYAESRDMRRRYGGAAEA